MAAETKIGLFLLSSTNQYQRLLEREAQEAAKRHGLALDVFYCDFGLQQSQDLIHWVHENAGQRLCALIMPVGDSDTGGAGSITDYPIHKLARRVASKGCGWIILNRDAEAHLTALRQEFPSLPIGMVSPDQKEFGRIQGRQFKTLLPAGGQLLYVLGNPFASSACDRRAGMLEETSGRSISVAEVDGLWLLEKARAVVQSWLVTAARRNTWPDLVGCQNDEMALGAREALVAAARELQRPALADVPVTGGDGLPEAGQAWVAEGKLAATIVLPSTTGLAVDQLAQTWREGRSLPLRTILQPKPHPPLEQLKPRR